MALHGQGVEESFEALLRALYCRHVEVLELAAVHGL
ncbi:MAG: hypothetical protein ACD_10C00244G0001, partial [uncultured bacterium]